MNQRRIFTFGVILLVLGCITSSYIGLMITGAKIEGILSTITTDSPTNGFEKFQCPLVLNKNETSSVVATILNPTSGSLDYRVVIQKDGISVQDPLYPYQVEVSIPGGQTTEVTWIIKSGTERGRGRIVVSALSSIDVPAGSVTGIHSFMSGTSFMDGCSIIFIDSTLTGKQALFLSITICIAMIFMGTFISFPRYSKMRQRVSTERKQLD